MQALSREVLEETGITIPTQSWKLFHVGDSLQSNRILIFGICKSVNGIDLNFKSETKKPRISFSLSRLTGTRVCHVSLKTAKYFLSTIQK
jgi:hypothetical protein